MVETSGDMVRFSWNVLTHFQCEVRKRMVGRWRVVQNEHTCKVTFKSDSFEAACKGMLLKDRRVSCKPHYTLIEGELY